MRIGLGQDSHVFSEVEKPLILGGVLLNSTGGLKANSDGDVIIHSLCNALSSAIGGESLSTWADFMCLEQKITDSQEYLKYIFKIVSKDYQIENISISIEADIPRLNPEQKKQIKSNLALILKINPDQIGITYTSGEKLTAFGQGQGIQSFSNVLLKEHDQS